jgi:hypothetical protein
MKDFFEAAKSLGSFLRDSFIIVLLIMAFVFPDWLRQRVNALGVSSAKLGELEVSFLDVRTSAFDAGGTLSQASITLGSILQQAAGGDPQHPGPATVAALVAELKPLKDLIDSKDQSVAASLKKADDQVPQVAQNVGKYGWIYLGAVNGDRSAWTSPAHIQAESPADLLGKTVTLRGNSYVREDRQVPAAARVPGWRVALPPIGVMSNGTRAKIEDVDYPPALGGGTALWAKVAMP